MRECGKGLTNRFRFWKKKTFREQIARNLQPNKNICQKLFTNFIRLGS